MLSRDEDCRLALTSLSPSAERVFAPLNAGNRGPDVFPETDRFDIGINSNRHLTFGSGVHFRLGAPLARPEGKIALQHLPELDLGGFVGPEGAADAPDHATGRSPITLRRAPSRTRPTRLS